MKKKTKEKNIFERLRLERTEKTVMQGEGRTTPFKKPLSQTELGRKLSLSQPVISRLENGETPTPSQVDAYHKYFHVRKSLLWGEPSTRQVINAELGLTDEAIKVIKGMSPISKSMLNVFLTRQTDANDFFFRLADSLRRIYRILSSNGDYKLDTDYLNITQHIPKLFMGAIWKMQSTDVEELLPLLDENFPLPASGFEDEWDSFFGYATDEQIDEYYQSTSDALEQIRESLSSAEVDAE